jgi:hypothetical protein
MGDALSLVQMRSEKVSSATQGEKDLVFVHVPMNFGTGIALTAAVGSGSNLTYNQMAIAAEGWKTVSKIAQPDAPVWGPLNPDLQKETYIGYPLYYTPAKYWPEDVKEKYFGDKTTFGVLRDPYERIVALFRSYNSPDGVSRGWDFVDDGQNCADDLNAFVKANLKQLIRKFSQHPKNANFHVQADYFEGDHAIQEVLDMDTFPQSANELLQKHGYNVNMGIDDVFHIHGCDDTFVDDLDAESKSLIELFYARDFKLRCEKLGHCDKTQHHCVVQSPGMCPNRLYNWDDATHRYVRK